jgi:antitoxin component YwqK of YwqJK toxin-antitoxin module
MINSILNTSKFMKGFIFFSLFTINSYFALAQDSLGFTNKAEAENKMVNGVKEGKWIVYIGGRGSNDNSAPYYKLIVYKAGKQNGIVHEYYNNGALQGEYSYTGGQFNGMAKTYYPNGQLKSESPWQMGKLNGVLKEYYENGKVKEETPFSNGNMGATKFFDENGKEKGF